MTDITSAIKELRPNSSFGVRGSTIIWNDSNNTQPTEEEINAKITELKNAEPMRLLRQERDKRLAETDWWTIRSNDTGVSLTQEQKDYKQALRDLPSTASPTLDNGVLSNVTWPTKPE
tara:strand:+ start:838 stop:1191 length:354 start_codon:yes stop_codon:yes gene_type:complete